MAHSLRDFEGKWIERDASTPEQRIFTLLADGSATSEGSVLAGSTEVAGAEERRPLLGHRVRVGADGRLCREGFALVHADPAIIRWRARHRPRAVSWFRYQEWKEFVLTVSASIDQGVDTRVACTSMAGEPVAASSLPIRATWREARLAMARQFQPYLTRKLRFVLPSGRLLSRADDARAIAEVCGLGAPARILYEERTKWKADGAAWRLVDDCLVRLVPRQLEAPPRRRRVPQGPPMEERRPCPW